MIIQTEIRVMTIQRHVVKTRWMQGFDVFEPSKVIAEISEYTCKVNEKATVTKLVDGFVAAIRADNNGEYTPVAVFCVGHPEYFFVDESVQMISDGKKWCVLSDLLAVYDIHYTYFSDPKEKEARVELLSELEHEHGNQSP